MPDDSHPKRQMQTRTAIATAMPANVRPLRKGGEDVADNEPDIQCFQPPRGQGLAPEGSVRQRQ